MARIIMILLLLLLPGCCTVVHDNYPVKHKPYLTKIEIREGEGVHYQAKWDTLIVPRDNRLRVTIHDLKLITEEPEDGNWRDIYLKALLLHEEAHARNQRQLCKPFKVLFDREGWLWWTEREGYYVQFKYLISRGVDFDDYMIEEYINIMTNQDVYPGMTTRAEARAFILSTIGERGLSKGGRSSHRLAMEFVGR